MDWVTCPACGLKHSRRPDGLCPRCRTGVFSGAPPSSFPARPPPPAFPPPPPPYAAASPDLPVEGGAAVAFPPPAQAGWGQPLPTTMIAPPRAVPVSRPLDVGTLVSRTFSTWWQDVWRYAVVMILAILPLVVTMVLGGGAAFLAGRAESSSPTVLLAIVPWLVAGGIATFVMMCVQMGGTIWATLQRLGGRPVTVGGMLGAGFRRAWPLFAANFLGSLLVGLGMLALLVPGIMLAVALFAMNGAVVAEGAGPGLAIERSFALTKGSRWTLFGAFVVVWLASFGINMGAGLLSTLFALGGAALAAVGMILALGVQLAAASLYGVLTAVAYHELRLAKEGVDTSSLEQVFE